MSDNSTKPVPQPSPQQKPDTTVLLLLTFVDTTWRIAAPVLLCVGGGIWMDLKFGTKPWVTITGLIVGFGIAALLIRQQIYAVNKRSNT